MDLSETFAVENLKRAWKKTVREGLRRQPVLDLHDFMDIHRNLEDHLEKLRIDILSGRYRPQAAEEVRLEKKLGITRRLLLPAPLDALILQTLVEAIEPTVKRGQRSKNAFYTRSHTSPKIEDVDASFAYGWWILWPQFQTRIWNFADAYPFVVNTDVANYFDTIPLHLLRNALASTGAFSEALLDFLFYMLESFLWRPDYIPTSGVGGFPFSWHSGRLTEQDRIGRRSQCGSDEI